MKKESLVDLAAKEVILKIWKSTNWSESLLTKTKNAVCQKFKINSFRNIVLISQLAKLEKNGIIPEDSGLKDFFRKRKVRTISGIAPISVLTKPWTCRGNCVYCPTEILPLEKKTLFQKDVEKKYGVQKIPARFQKPGVQIMPKSYLSSEPAAMRALLADFDPFLQTRRRIEALKKTGHDSSKCEIIVIGGTFSDLPKRYQTYFLTRVFQALNSDNFSEKTSLVLAQKKNETAEHRAVGLTLETRPDAICKQEVRRFRKFGCTRVEIGVQTLDDEISKKTGRQQKKTDVIRATKLLRNAGFKISYHLMPNLPFSTPQKDLEVFREICEKPDFKPDLLKIYPTAVVPFSRLEKWFRDGKYQPYSDEILFDILEKMKIACPQWIRISRLIRDIPGTAIIAGNKKTNLRQILQKKMTKNKTNCHCIRCREIRSENFDSQKAKLEIEEYSAGDGKEFFLQFVSEKEKKLLALLRLRIFNKKAKILFRALRGTAIIRELHTFGRATKIGRKEKNVAQHFGFGKKLIVEAEKIVRNKKIKKLAVISGIGVKNFYRKLGFYDDGSYLVKKIS